MDDAPEEENEGQDTFGHNVNHSAKQNDLKWGQEEKTETEESVADAPIPFLSTLYGFAAIFATKFL